MKNITLILIIALLLSVQTVQAEGLDDQTLKEYCEEIYYEDLESCPQMVYHKNIEKQYPDYLYEYNDYYQENFIYQNRYIYCRYNYEQDETAENECLQNQN